MIGIIKRLSSHELIEGDLPNEIDNCAVSLIISIGTEKELEAETFFLEVITIDWFRKINRPIWGARSLIVPCFEWQKIRQEIEQMLLQCQSETWEEMIEKISYFLDRDRK